MEPRPGDPGFVAPDPAARPRRRRRAVRLLVLDPEDRILLFEDSDLGLAPTVHMWITPGGGVDPGESDEEAAVRELAEETGYAVSVDDLVGPVVTRVVTHGYSDQVVDQDEVYYVVRVPARPLDHSQWTEDERHTLRDVRWFGAAQLGSLDLWPRTLADIWRLADSAGGVSDLGWSEESTVPAGPPQDQGADGLDLATLFRAAGGPDPVAAWLAVLLPWEVDQRHEWCYEVAMLRNEARLRAGKMLGTTALKALTRWKESLADKDLVVDYDPHSVEGCHLTRRRPGIDLDLVREPDA